MASYVPRFGDYFPRTRRGHGTTHPDARVKGTRKVRNACACVMPTCALNMRKGGEDHEGHKANVEDWQDERGLLVKEGKARFPKKEQKVAPYKPAPRAVVPAVQTRRETCECCGHTPSGKDGDTGLELGLCAKCWKRGYSKKFTQADDRGRVAA